MPKREPLDLHEVVNPECRHCKNKKERTTSNGLCDAVTSVRPPRPDRENRKQHSEVVLKPIADNIHPCPLFSRFNRVEAS